MSTCVTLIWLILLVPLPAQAVVLAWGASPTATGYHLIYGLQSGAMDTILDTGPLTQASVGGLFPGYAYVFGATAYNEWGESGFSNLVEWTEPAIGVVITSPPDGSLVERKSTVTVQVEAHLPGGVQQVAILVDTDALCVTSQMPYHCLWRVPPANRRTYRLQAQAWNPSGDSWPSAVVTVISE